MSKIIKGIKGLDRDFKCRDMQFEVGKEFTAKGKPIACENGIHFCEDPLDVLAYYNPADSRFAEVESRGETAKHNEDSKVATDRLFIKAEISLKTVIDWGVKLIIERTKDKKEVNSGYRSAAVNSGDSSAAVNSGNRSAAVNSGDRSAAEVSGSRSVAVALGFDAKAKGKIGCWLTVSEWDKDYNRIDVRTAKVDGKEIKEGVFYKLVGGKFIEA